MYDLLICDIAYIFAVAIVALCQVLNLPLMDIEMLQFSTETHYWQILKIM